jgi:homoserine kinase type II
MLTWNDAEMPRIPVAQLFGLDVDRLEPTRSGDAESDGNGNWHLWTRGGEHLVLRRYHLLHTESDLAFEAQVLDHLAGRGWVVPALVAPPIRYDGRLWSVTRFVPGKPHENETRVQRAERGAILARLHAALGGLELGERERFFRTADLDAMGEFQQWDRGIELLRERRPDLVEEALRAMGHAKRLVIARVHRAPELVDGYQRATATPLTDRELAAIEPLQVVLRVLMVMAALWDGQRSGTFDEAMITDQLEKFRS